VAADEKAPGSYGMMQNNIISNMSAASGEYPAAAFFVFLMYTFDV
jgi:hypothetical protein